MAKVTGIYRYESGEAVSFEVKVATSYPDALDEAKATVITALCELTGMSRRWLTSGPAGAAVHGTSGSGRPSEEIDVSPECRAANGVQRMCGLDSREERALCLGKKRPA